MNRKLVMVVGLLCLLSSASLAIDFMGPPTAELNEGQWSFGFLYSSSERDLEVEGFGINAPLDDVETTRYFANLGYGLTDWWEFGLRLGVAESEIDDIDFNGGTDFAIGWGTKITFASDENIDWGALFQASWSQGDESYNYDFSEYGLGTGKFNIDIDAYEIQMAVGPTIKMEGCTLYGGPFVYLVYGDLDAKALGVTVNFDIEEDSAVGGYIGAAFDLAENTTLSVEYAAIDGGSAIGALIGWKF